MEIVKIKGTMVTAQRHQHVVTRNASWFKKVQSNPLRPAENQREEHESEADKFDNFDFSSTEQSISLATSLGAGTTRPENTQDRKSVV